MYHSAFFYESQMKNWPCIEIETKFAEPKCRKRFSLLYSFNYWCYHGSSLWSHIGKKSWQKVTKINADFFLPMRYVMEVKWDRHWPYGVLVWWGLKCNTQMQSFAHYTIRVLNATRIYKVLHIISYLQLVWVVDIIELTHVELVLKEMVQVGVMENAHGVKQQKHVFLKMTLVMVRNID